MKTTKFFVIIGVFIAGFTVTATAQQTLPEIVVKARSYKYLKSVDNTDATESVRMLEHKAAAYDIKSSEYYSDEYDSYSITFYLPNGFILAMYNSEGKLISTAERFKNVALPEVVRSSVLTRFPGWAITKDIYLVKYSDAEGGKMVYKMVLANGSKRIRIKSNEQGEILD